MSINPFVSDPLRSILGGDAAGPHPFPDTSRYAAVELAQLELPGGKKIVYLRQRIAPLPSRFSQVAEHLVVDGDRLDNIATRYLGDPEQFWQICDANGAMRAEDLEVVGTSIRITLPVDVPEPARA